MREGEDYAQLTEPWLASLKTSALSISQAWPSTCQARCDDRYGAIVRRPCFALPVARTLARQRPFVMRDVVSIDSKRGNVVRCSRGMLIWWKLRRSMLDTCGQSAVQAIDSRDLLLSVMRSSATCQLPRPRCVGIAVSSMTEAH